MRWVKYMRLKLFAPSSMVGLLHAEVSSASYATFIKPSVSRCRSVSKHSASLNWVFTFNLGFSQLSAVYYSSNCDGSESDKDECFDDDNHGIDRLLKSRKDVNVAGLGEILRILQPPEMDRSVMRNKLEHCGVEVTSELVLEVLSRVRNDWEAAFTFFVWAGRQQGYSHTTREYNSMISILGKMRKFDTAWSVISEMKRNETGDVPLVTPQTLMIMIRKYCAVHDIGRAINAFHSHKRFNFPVGTEEFHGLLSALCRYKNVRDAEHLMLSNRNVFPLNTKSFNIVLNGWCNMIVCPRQAERVWREMGTWGIEYDVISFACMISCYAKIGGVYRVFKKYNAMKEMGIEPNRKVYNAVIHALAKSKFLKEAKSVIQTMEEKGISPDNVTYNSLIKPLCTAEKIDEAKAEFDEMLRRGLSPTVRTFHALIRVLRSGEEVFDLLKQMRAFGCPPCIETYNMVIKKFCRWRQFDVASRMWDEMREVGICHDRSSYAAMIYGLFLNGKLDESYRYYSEMKEKGLLPEPKMDTLLQSWFSSKQITEVQLKIIRESEHSEGTKDKSMKYSKNFIKDAASRRVIRERGVSFLVE